MKQSLLNKTRSKLVCFLIIILAGTRSADFFMCVGTIEAVSYTLSCTYLKLRGFQLVREYFYLVAGVLLVKLPPSANHATFKL